MKKLQLILGAFVILFTMQSSAQVSVSLNIGTRPTWCGNYYDDRVQYVYLPELECYYDNFAEVYVYYGPSGWCRSSYLPDYCHGYDIHRAPRVVIDYRGASPWTHFDYHRNHYWRNNYRNYRQAYYGPSYYTRRGNTVAVIDRRDYRDNHDHYYRHNGRGNGNAYGHYKKHDDDDDDDDDRGRGNARGGHYGRGEGRGHGRR
jgi:hypothetical protein